MSPDRLLAKLRVARERVALRAAHRPFPSYPENLPITARRDEIVDAIQKNQVLVLAGETGSGKSTQLPKMCLDAGRGIRGMIGCTQPRRVAALSVSKRIAEELDTEWGREVGCKIRFSDKTSQRSYIKMMTDGMLLAEVQGDPELLAYDTILIDEAHERSLNIDFLLGHLGNLLARRPELKLIITSATIDTESFSKAFNGAPIMEVSGRTYPVEVLYLPFDELAAGGADLTYIDAAADAVEVALSDSPDGDVLVFMPGEKDIRETTEIVRGRCSSRVEILPLFGRLSAADQQRVFGLTHHRRVVIATNVAETSITLPNIRYVVDPGLARMSRYNARTRTRRLPIEPVSQSSANQRKGRCGRVANGICIRLYSEDDFSERPAFTQPEIQRSNLAEVILRMMASGLGEIETFPFINPPKPEAIHSGYQLLKELGALDSDSKLTQLGRELARFPLDPSIARMILQARDEHALTEVAVIAAGLSIQDPRETPFDKRDAARQAHAHFNHPDSDFLSLLNIWKAYQQIRKDGGSQNQQRKFCRQRFVSYLRMREWTDVHFQICQTIKAFKGFQFNKEEANYAAIHRSILAGFLGHTAHRLEANLYEAAQKKQLLVFPGSVLRIKPKSKDSGGKAVKEKQPEWIVAAEFTETSQRFAKTIGGLKPKWIADVGKHICSVTYTEPRWEPKQGRVVATEQLKLHGVKLDQRSVDFGSIDPQIATDIFVRSALIEEPIQSKLPFLKHNESIRERIESYQTRIRRHDWHDLDDRLFRFYRERIQNVSSIHDLNRFCQEQSKDDPQFLFIEENQLTGGDSLETDQAAFPDRIQTSSGEIELDYAYAPGEAHDGVTVKLTANVLHSLTQAELEWIVPGLREEKVAALFKSLPKSVRRELSPFPPKMKCLVEELKPRGDSLQKAIAQFIQERFQILIPSSAWNHDLIPNHLKPTLELKQKGTKKRLRTENLTAIVDQLENDRIIQEDKEWKRLCENFDRFDLDVWSFGNVPEIITHESKKDVLGFPGLSLEDQSINLRLFRTRKEAERQSFYGWRKLIERSLSRELMWLEKDLKDLKKTGPLYAPLGPFEELHESTYKLAIRHIINCPIYYPLVESIFLDQRKAAQERIKGLAHELTQLIQTILQERQSIAASNHLFEDKDIALNTLVPRAFPNKYSLATLQQLPRYLKALRVRAERASYNPAKDQEKASRVAPWENQYREFLKLESQDLVVRSQISEFGTMVEEFKITTFAPEIGTAFPVSTKRLEKKATDIRKLLESI